jgi:hypothetical protein
MLQFNNIKKFNKSRCFILGNSPCLKNVDLSLLKNEIIFIANQGFKAINIGLQHYNFYVISDPREIDKSKNEINTQVKCIKFVSSLIYKKNQSHVLHEPYIYFNRNKGMYSTYPENFNKGWGKVYSVVLDSAIIASLMGFKQIYFIGVSFDYSGETQHFYHENQINTGNLVTDNMENISKVCYLINKDFKNKNVQLYNCTENWKYPMLIEPSNLTEVI